MRIIRLTQLCLKRSDFPPSRLPKLLDSTPTNPASLQIFPQSRFPQKLDKTVLGLRSGVLGWFLPEGFPYSVHANYLKFTTWTSLQGITSSFISVLSTQAMLGTLMTISSTEADSSSSSWLSSGAASATINWILKDGLGQAGGIALVSLLGSRLDSQARLLRFHSTLLFLFGSLLEFSIPLACSQSPLSPSMTFLILASTANILKNVSWMVVSATRAHFMKHLALRGNLGDLTGKAASQMTLASLLGTAFGLTVLKSFNSPIYLFATWFINALVSVYSTHRACKVAISSQLNPQRIFKLIENFKIHRTTENSSQISSISRYFWTPEIFASRENFIWPRKSEKLKNILFNEPLTLLSNDFDWIVPMDQIETKKFSIARKDDSLYIWTLESALPRDKISSIITAALAHYNLSTEFFEVDSILEALKRQGWDVEHFSFKPLDDKFKCVRIIESKEE